MTSEARPGGGDNRTVIVGDVGNTCARFARVVAATDPRGLDGRLHASVVSSPGFGRPVRVPTRDLDVDGFRRVIAEVGVANALWRIASVHQAASQMLAGWQWQDDSCLDLVSYRDFPLPIAVEHPERVGVDRLAAAWAASRLKAPTSSAVVIDAGTAITVDAVAADGTFLGGTISPGLIVAIQALNQNASQLPLIDEVSAARDRPVIGRNTEEAIASGVWWGCVGAVRELVARVRQELNGDSEVFATGGDGPLMAEYLSVNTRVVPDLVWRGLLW